MKGLFAREYLFLLGLSRQFRFLDGKGSTGISPRQSRVRVWVRFTQRVGGALEPKRRIPTVQWGACVGHRWVREDRSLSGRRIRRQVKFSSKSVFYISTLSDRETIVQ